MKTIDDRGKPITLERIDWHLRKLRSRKHVRLSKQQRRRERIVQRRLYTIVCAIIAILAA